LDLARDWIDDYAGRIQLIAGRFSQMQDLAQDHAPLDGVALDLGVSSMQLDRAERGFSFMQDGPLDMRMAQSGPSAADLVNGADESVLADILYHYGEERAARRIARAIVAERERAALTTTGVLAGVIETCLPRRKPGQSHPATRSFQALRIAVNDEMHELVKGLSAAERMLRPGGKLAVVSFHSIEDRIVKRFMAQRASAPSVSRYAPVPKGAAPSFKLTPKKAIAPDADELAINPRARSAKLRVATRTDAPVQAGDDLAALGLPQFGGA
jgi:16S rRNA (cytosine1402-N4)-methyltransferase